MRTLDLNDTGYRGNVSRPATSTLAITPTCTRCGSDLAGRRQPTQRFLDRATGTVATVHRWRCGCGRTRTLRKLEEAETG